MLQACHNFTTTINLTRDYIKGPKLIILMHSIIYKIYTTGLSGHKSIFLGINQLIAKEIMIYRCKNESTECESICFVGKNKLINWELQVTFLSNNWILLMD